MAPSSTRIWRALWPTLEPLRRRVRHHATRQRAVAASLPVVADDRKREVRGAKARQLRCPDCSGRVRQTGDADHALFMHRVSGDCKAVYKPQERRGRTGQGMGRALGDGFHA